MQGSWAKGVSGCVTGNRYYTLDSPALESNQSLQLRKSAEVRIAPHAGRCRMIFHIDGAAFIDA